MTATSIAPSIARQFSGELEPQLIALRRAIHQNPELAFRESSTAQRLEDALRALGVDTRDFFVPCSAQPFLQAHVPARQAFPVANDIAERGCYLPSGLALSDAQIEAVADAIDEVLA